MHACVCAIKGTRDCDVERPQMLTCPLQVRQLPALLLWLACAWRLLRLWHKLVGPLSTIGRSLQMVRSGRSCLKWSCKHAAILGREEVNSKRVKMSRNR